MGENIRKHRLLILGIASPLLAAAGYVLVYGSLTRLSHNHERDWLFRLSMGAVAMTLPFVLVLWLTVKERRATKLGASSVVGLCIAALSLALTWFPIRDGVVRLTQTRNQALSGVAAPALDATDLFGMRQKTEEQIGKVVVVNVWATWCVPCRDEMPKLDRLYRERKSAGLMVFGLSDEDPETQKKFLQAVPVSYPLLTTRGTIPAFYRQISVYPANFLIDRSGKLRTAPLPGQPFDKLEASVEMLLKEPR